MCGITAILSKNNLNIIPLILDSLNLIQNRGYDSHGLCYQDISNNCYKINKYASYRQSSSFDLLKNQLNKQDISSSFAIGHTRWATHGGKTDNNAHPHISNNKNIILVHNGIINNFKELKDKLIKKGFNFLSETDSEVIANLIEYQLIYMNDSIENAIKNTINQLQGTWALVIIYTKNLDTFYITRHGSPLLLGETDNYILCSSETNGFIGLVYDYIVLDNHDIIEIKNNKITNLNCDISYDIKKVDKNEFIESKMNYKHWMLKEIMEQPETIKKAFNYGGRIIDNKIILGGLDQYISLFQQIEYVLLIGSGTSYHSGLIGEIYLNNCKNFIVVNCINSSEFTKKKIPKIKDKQKILCIFLSQSGETLDVYNCFKICKEEGCYCIGVINKVDSLIAREVDCGVYLNAGLEISVASTKSFTSMMIVLSLISLWFDRYNINNSNKLNSLRSLSNTITSILYSIEFLKSIESIKKTICENMINNIFILGKSNLYPIALEASLKIKEVCYIHCEGFSASSLKHGPLALLDKTNLTLLLIDYTDKTNYKNLQSTYYEINSRETNLIVITNHKKVVIDLNLNKTNSLLLPYLDYYNEIIFIVALQLLAYQLSIEKNINPDQPRNLAKVVTVE